MKKIYIVAVVAALISAVLLYVFLSSYDKKNSEDSKVNYNTEQVVVALVDIDANTTVTDKMVTVVDMPVDGIHPDAARERADIVGKVVTCDVVAQEQMLTSKLVSSDNGGAALSYQIEEGKRAMSIAVDSASGVAGYIEAGDLVDVILVADASPNQKVKTESGENMEIGGKVTSVVVESAKVLRIGDFGYATASQEVYTSLTLEVSPEQSARLAAAKQMGAISVSLRYKNNNRVLHKGPYSSSDMIKN